MKIFAAFVVIVAMTIGCQIPPPVFDIGVCTAGKLGPKVAEIKAQVLTCLSTGEYAPCLESLGRTIGTDVVLCAVREFTGVGATPATSPDVRERARAYLDAKGVKS